MKRITPTKLAAAYKFVNFVPARRKFFDNSTHCGCPVTAMACYLEGIKEPPANEIKKDNVGNWAIDTLNKYGYHLTYLRGFWHAIDGIKAFIHTLAVKDAERCMEVINV